MLSPSKQKGYYGAHRSAARKSVRRTQISVAVRFQQRCSSSPQFAEPALPWRGAGGREVRGWRGGRWPARRTTLFIQKYGVVLLLALTLERVSHFCEEGSSPSPGVPPFRPRTRRGGGRGAAPGGASSSEKIPWGHLVASLRPDGSLKKPTDPSDTAGLPAERVFRSPPRGCCRAFHREEHRAAARLAASRTQLLFIRVFVLRKEEEEGEPFGPYQRAETIISKRGEKGEERENCGKLRKRRSGS